MILAGTESKRPLNKGTGIPQKKRNQAAVLSPAGKAIDISAFCGRCKACIVFMLSASLYIRAAALLACNGVVLLRVLYKKQAAYINRAYKSCFSSLRQLISWVGRGLRFRVMPSGLKNTWSIPASRAPSMSHS